MLDKIKVKPLPEEKKPPRVGMSTSVEQHTYDFIWKEAKARNMGASEFLREVCELLESGDF